MVSIKERSGSVHAFIGFFQLNSCISTMGFMVTLHHQKWSKINLLGIQFGFVSLYISIYYEGTITELLKISNGVYTGNHYFSYSIHKTALKQDPLVKFQN